jgi:hypothetical protein
LGLERRNEDQRENKPNGQWVVRHENSPVFAPSLLSVVALKADRVGDAAIRCVVAGQELGSVPVLC